MKYIDRLFKAPAGVSPDYGLTPQEREAAMMRAAGPPPPLPAPVPATKQLRTNLERVTLAYNDRERVLVKEIAEREAELADVRRARDATTAALMELDVDLPEIAVPDAPIGIDAATGGLVFADDAPHQDLDAIVEEQAAALKFGGARHSPHRTITRG